MADYYEVVHFKLYGEHVHLKFFVEDVGGTLVAGLNSPHTGNFLVGWWAQTRHHDTAVEGILEVLEKVEHNTAGTELPCSLGDGKLIIQEIENVLLESKYRLWDGTPPYAEDKDDYW